MKYFSFFAGVLIAGTTLAQSDVGRVVKTNPLGFFAGQYQIAYEHALTDNISAQLSLGYIGGSTTLSDTTATDISTSRNGYIAIPEVRWYPKGGACSGFYVSLAGRFRSVSNTADDTGETLLERTASGGAMLVGYQSIKENMAWEFFVGPQYKSVTNTSDLVPASTSLNEENDGVGVRFGVNIGFGF